MSTRQLRNKRKSTAVPDQNGDSKLIALSKKQKKTVQVESSESEESSSDEFVRPSNQLKVRSSGVSVKREPSPVADFSSIEKSIFSEVSRLSDSDSDDSDFEEVTEAPPSNLADINVKSSSIKEVKPSNAQISSSKEESKAEGTQIMKKPRGRPPKNAKQNLSKVKTLESQTQCGSKAAEDAPKTDGRASESLKSDSDSNDSDFEEVTEVPPSNRPNINGIKSPIKDFKLSNAQSSPKPKEEPKVEAKILKKPRGRPPKNAKQDLSKEKTENQTQRGSSAAEDAPKNEGRASRSSKRKLSDEVNTSIKPLKKDQKNYKSPEHSKGEALPGKPKSLVPSVSSSKEKVLKAGSKQIIKEENAVKVELKRNIPESVDNLDIAQLLALGEGLKTSGKTSEVSDSENDDWEEVDTAEVKKHEIPKEGVQITLEMPEFSWRRKKQRDQQACMEAEMNRAFNRVRRELQLLCHKASLLLWLGHGIFLNRAINSDNVKAMALSLVPVDLCTLPKKPGRKYVDQIMKWFSKEFECSEGFPEVISKKKAPPLAAVLEQHFSRRYAKSVKELTFMFVTVLRALGLESRLVISFQPMPLKPQSNELLSINPNSKRGRRVSKKSSKDSENSDDPDDPDEQESPSSLKKNPKTSKDNDTGVKGKDKSVKPGRKSAPPMSEGALEKRVSGKTGNSQGRKSLPANSPSKNRGMRGAKVKKSYKEQTDSDNESSEEEDSKPILSPEKKIKLDKDTAERLKKAASKRIPANRRLALKSSVEAGPSKYFDSDDDFEPKRNSRGKSGKSTSPSKKPSTSRKSSSQNPESDDSDFEVKPVTKARSKSSSSNTPKKGRPSKSDQSKKKDDDSGKKYLTSSGSDYWVEVYLQDDERWVCVDVPSKKIDSTKEILAKASQPITYVVGFNPDGSLKDVTKRYAPKFSQVTCKQRVSTDWWDKTLKPFRPRPSKREAAEDSEMNLVELDRPMPKSVGECKNHPLYVLKRHLLKFEAIYPPDAPSLGFVRNEAIYARQNVYTLHSREIWMKDAKVVRLGEQPYKIVKARPKYDRLSGKTITDLPLEVFGPWQVEDYVPPPAVDGKVPRNAYGNVELFKPSMLPKGCVHLQVPGLTRVAKKLRIDCAPAVVGFDYHSGGCHPTYDGFVVCEEHVDVLMDAWNKEIDESAKRREEKHEKRVYGNWRRLIKGLLIREQLKYRYDFEGEEGQGSSQSSVNSEALKASRITQEDAPLPSLFPKLMANIRAQKTRQRKSAGKEVKRQSKGKQSKQDQKGGKSKPRRKRKDETSDEEESDWDSSTTEEDESGMVLLSDEDSGSEFEDLKK